MLPQGQILVDVQVAYEAYLFLTPICHMSVKRKREKNASLLACVCVCVCLGTATVSQVRKYSHLNEYGWKNKYGSIFSVLHL